MNPAEVRVGDWTLVRRLGEGGMGVVHLAQDDGGRLAALKVLRPHVVGDEEARERLEREVQTLGRVRSPLVAEIVDADPWGPVPFVATRYVDGPSLHDQVGALGPLGSHALHRFAADLARALQAVHQVGVVHRDVKPSNVVIEGDTPILIDFGLARLGDDTRLTRTGFLLGTPGFLAPEILYGEEPGPASDVHAWAATVAFAGTGRSPYGSGPAMAVMDRVRRGEHDLSGLDPKVRVSVEAALDPDPLRRPTLPALLAVLDGKQPARPAPTVVVPLATAVMPHPTQVIGDEPPVSAFDADPEDDAEELPLWSSAPPKPKVTLGERLRRWAIGLALLGLVVAGGIAAPFVTAAGLALAVAVLRWGAVVVDGHRGRREARGRRWWDLPRAVLLSPVTLLVSLPVTVLLWLTAGALGTIAVFVCMLAVVPEVQWLPWAAGVSCLALWLGPGSRRVRRPVGGLVRGLARHPGGWLLALLVLLGLTAAAAYAIAGQGTEWLPLEAAPWDTDLWAPFR